MHRVAQSIKLLMVIVLLGATQWACDNSCVALSKTICNCEATSIQQQGCIRRVESDARSNKANAAELEVCEALLEDCSCERLDAGDLAACGLAEE